MGKSYIRQQINQYVPFWNILKYKKHPVIRNFRNTDYIRVKIDGTETLPEKGTF